MGISVHKDRQGPDWPLGIIAVAAPGTQVSIMSLVDAANVNAPESPTPGTSGADEYTPRAQQIIFQSVKAGAAPPLLAANTAAKFVYIVRKPTGGNGGTGDTGVIVKALSPGETFILTAAALNRNALNPYRYFIDADTVGDGCLVTLIIE